MVNYYINTQTFATTNEDDERLRSKLAGCITPEDFVEFSTIKIIEERKKKSIKLKNNGFEIDIKKEETKPEESKNFIM